MVLAASTLTVMAGATISPIINLMRMGLQISSTQVAFIITTHSLVVALSSPVIGRVIDLVGTRKPLVAGLVIYGVGGSAGYFIDSYLEILLSRIVLGLGVSAIFVTISVIITDLFDGPDRDLMMGRRVSANNFGGIIWPILGGSLGVYSWQFPFLVYLVALPIAAIALWCVSETHINRGRIKSEDGESVGRIFKANPVLFAILGLVLLTTIGIYTIVIYLPQLLEKLGIASSLTIGLFISAMTLASGTTSFLYAKIKSEVSYRTIFMGATFLWVTAFTSISQVSYTPAIIAAVALAGIGQGAALPASLVWAGDISPSAFSGRVLSYVGTAAFFGQFMAPTILSPIVNIAGIRAAFLTTGGLSAIVFLILGLGAVSARLRNSG